MALRAAVFTLALTCSCAAAAQVYQPSTCRNAFTPQQEITEGNKVVAEVYRQMPVLPDSNPVSVYVRKLGARLAAVAPLTPGMEQRWPFQFHVVASEEINAFALPGGTMFVNLGAIRAADSEAQLAGVMGHEMSHVVLRHSTCNLTQQQKKSLWYGLGAIGSSILLGADSGVGKLARGAIGMGQSLDFLHMSRGDEQQADLLGAQITHDAGFDPRGLPQFFEIIQAKYGSGGAQFLSDHPNPGNRTAYVNQEIAQLPPLRNPIRTSPAFISAKAAATALTVYDSKAIQAGQWRSTGLYAASPGGSAGVVPAPASSTNTSSGDGAGSAVSISPLPASSLGPRDRLTTLQMPRYALSFPESWQRQDQKDDAITLAPRGGAGSFGVAYGVLSNVVNVPDPGATDDASLRVAAQAIVQRFTQGGGVSQTGDIQSIRVRGRLANSVTLRGSSPVAESGRALPERDWLIVIARPDANVNYLVFVAPERDFDTLKPTFDAILNSLQVQ